MDNGYLSIIKHINRRLYMRLKFNKQTYETKIIKSNLDLIFPKLEDELKKYRL